MTVLVWAEHNGISLKKSTRQTISAAQAWNEPVHVLVVGHQVSAVAQDAATLAGVAEVIQVDAPHLAHVLAEDLAACLVEIGKDYQVILANHAPYARNALARAAALLDVGMVSDVIHIEAPAIYTHPVFAGSILETVVNTDAIQILTVRGSAFSETAPAPVAHKITERNAPKPQGLSRWIREDVHASDRPELTSARVVVAGGRALGEQFNTLLQPLAGKLGAAIGASRSAVDAGLAANDIQVGQTGIVIAPDLYIAIGISGAIQHVAGIKDSKVIVAINNDPDAPIFQIADYGLVGDLFTLVPELVAGITGATSH
ncbi:MAG: electron transfer flavoprotein subunit alpha/FixB family protein [Proteobacteria bacterium]|nr:electron transfer flavoprotein subunit alpha/FixB family protein [Pseudomonadota bacterium]